MPERKGRIPFRQKVTLTDDWRREFSHCLDRQGVISLRDVARAAKLERHIVTEMVDPNPGTIKMNPGYVGRVLNSAVADELERAYLWGLIGRQLPLFPLRDFFNRATESVGSAVDRVIGDVGLNLSQQQGVGNVVIPFARRVAVYIRDN